MMNQKTVNNENWISEETRQRLTEEMKQLKIRFKTWLRNEDGRATFRNLFQVFGRPPDGNSELEFARFTGRMEVLHYIINHSDLLGGNENGQWTK
jgi:hypothetical protein